MKSNLTNYLIVLILNGCFLFTIESSFLVAQSFDSSPDGTKIFGYSLKKPEKRKKEKEESILPPVNFSKQENDEIIRIETTLIMNEVLVFDKNGNHIKGLQKEDFMVKEDDQIQEISTFISGDSELVPRSIVLIIDYSGSQLPFIETSIEAAKILIDKLNPNDRIALVTDKVELLQGFTNDKNLLKEKLESLKISALSGQVGPSKQYSALMATLNEIFKDESLRPIIIFQTDGDELPLLKGEPGNTLSSPNSITFTYKDVLTATEKMRTTIYTIIPGLCINEIAEKERFEQAAMYFEINDKMVAKIRNFTLNPNRPKRSMNTLKSQVEWLEQYQSAITKLAKFTGGSTKCLEQVEQAGEVYAEVLSEINQRYVIGYYPQNQERDGRSRNLTTEVRGHPEYKIVGRKSYILAH